MLKISTCESKCYTAIAKTHWKTHSSICIKFLVSDKAIFVLKRDVELQPIKLHQIPIFTTS